LVVSYQFQPVKLQNPKVKLLLPRAIELHKLPYFIPRSIASAFGLVSVRTLIRHENKPNGLIPIRRGSQSVVYERSNFLRWRLGSAAPELAPAPAPAPETSTEAPRKSSQRARAYARAHRRFGVQRSPRPGDATDPSGRNRSARIFDWVNLMAATKTYETAFKIGAKFTGRRRSPPRTKRSTLSSATRKA
jgi:hypothetical protein